MTDFAKTYALTRTRFNEAVEGLNQQQLNYRLHDNALTIGEMALHLAGVEVWFMAQLHGTELSGADEKLAKCSTDGSINDLPFPFSPEEITPEVVKAALAQGKDALQETIESPSAAILGTELKSALGPMITGEGALVRLCAHPFYHQGQIYMIKSAPGFPS
jgi:uncharacterized damage-inducible protein DinB